MPDWAVVLVAAFGGGLAGAVLQPLASHVLERVRREEEIRKRRERHLRRMVEARIESRRTHELALAFVCGFRRLGKPAPSAREVIEDHERREPPPPAPTYWPERIPDPHLRQTAIEYGKLVAELTGPLRFQDIDPATEDKLLQLTDRIRPLEEEIVRRMDELNWPEVDE
jgi:hypothetical protein